ncbi:hypothetical protein FRX31_028529 [Thalictrum thalictroides]|uniref:Uncharacterized protein n=1 Tax=Thalictrum thalictroides TaxID=46969 RepID=A0A7J6VA89_THATH|nr:hypothetical protein FRX31_028529 [Thalictrum thalictroides]
MSFRSRDCDVTKSHGIEHTYTSPNAQIDMFDSGKQVGGGKWTYYHTTPEAADRKFKNFPESRKRFSRETMPR